MVFSHACWLQEEMEAKNTQLQQKDDQLWQKDQQLLQKDIQLQDKDRQLQEKDRRLQDKDCQLQEKDRQLKEKDEQLLQRVIALRVKHWWNTYSIVLKFRGSLISNFQLFAKIFQWKFLTHGVQCAVHAAKSLQNYFNEIFKNCYSRKFRPSKI